MSEEVKGKIFLAVMFSLPFLLIGYGYLTKPTAAEEARRSAETAQAYHECVEHRDFDDCMIEFDGAPGDDYEPYRQ